MQLTIADRKRHNLEPGSAEWLAHRAEQFNAGDTGAALGCDSNKSRTDLLDELQQGFGQEVGYFQQRVFDAGHRVEALARPLAERIMGEELYPFVYSAVALAAANGAPLLQRRLGASVDGAPLSAKAKLHWECKSLNDELRSALPHKGQADIANNDAKRLPKKYRTQMCQQALVRGSEAVLFSACEFDAQGNVVDERHAYYEPEPELCEEVIRGWVQLEQDLASHKPVVHAERPKGEKLEAIGLPMVRVMGSVVESNLPAWRQMAFARIEAINRDLKTDEDFGQAKEDVKWLDEGAKAVKKLKADVLGQMVTVNEVVTTLDEIVAMQDRTRRELERLVESREKEIRSEVCAQYEHQAAAHRLKMVARIEALQLSTQPSALIPALTHALVAADFAKAIKSKRTIKSLHDSCGAELSRVKIALSSVTDRVELNLKHFQAECLDWRHLFMANEMATLVLKEEADFQAVCGQRIQQAKKADEERRQREEAEAQRRREAEEARRRQEETLAAELAERRRQEEAQRATAAPVPASAAYPQAVGQPPLTTGAAPAPSATVLRMPATTPAPSPAPSAPPTLKLGTINERLGLFQVTADHLAELGFPVVATDKGAKLYRDGDFPAMCRAIASHAEAVGERFSLVAA